MTQLITDPRAAALRLHAGALVGVPTETVYGLAADADDELAVRRVFEVKGRPLDHPLIVHLDQPADAQRWARNIDPRLADLMAQHWPGPLTVIVPKAGWVPDVITGGQPTVALRVPAHPLIRAVLAELSRLKGAPAAVVAPSANSFGEVSPTTAGHVLAGLGSRLSLQDAVLDGGPCRIGVESTVVAVVGGELRVLRPGSVAVAQTGIDDGEEAAPRAPGTLPAHYAPAAAVVLADPAASQQQDLVELVSSRTAGHPAGQVAMVALASVPTPEGWFRLAAPADIEEYAHCLYASLREADALGVGLLVAVPPAAGGLGDAVRDRLLRAAAGSQQV